MPAEPVHPAADHAAPAGGTSGALAGVPAPPSGLADLPPRPLVLVGTVVLAALLAVTVLLAPPGHGPGARALPFAVVLAAGLVLANGWTRVVDLPSRKGTALVAAFAAVATSVSVLLPRGGQALQWLPVALAVGVVAAFLHQLLRTDARPRVVASLSGSLLAVALLAAGACWIASVQDPVARIVAVAAALGLAVAALVEHGLRRLHVGRGPADAAVAGMLVGTLAGWFVTGALGPVAAGAAVATALACIGAACVRALLAPLPALVARRAQLVSATASVLAAGPLVLLVARGPLG